MSKKIIKDAINTYKIAPLSSWILGLTTGLLITGFLALDLLVPFISLLIFPLLILPMIFSATMQHIIFKTKGQLTAGSSFKSFALYFVYPFNGSFGFLFSLLKGVITFFSLELIISFTLSTVLESATPHFAESINAFYDLLESGEFTIEGFNNILFMNHDLLFNYFLSVLCPSYFIALIVVIYSLSRNSIMIYYRMHIRVPNSRMYNFVYRDALRRVGGKLRKDYFLLNWPLYVLLLIGIVSGLLTGYFVKHDLFMMFAFAILFASIGVTLFLPFYFGNQETLYDYYFIEFQTSTKNVTKYMIQSLQQNIELSEEEKKTIENTFSDLTDKEENKDNNEESK